MVLELKSHTILCLLTFTCPLTSLAYHSVRIFVGFWLTYFRPIFRNIAAMVNSTNYDYVTESTAAMRSV